MREFRYDFLKDHLGRLCFEDVFHVHNDLLSLGSILSRPVDLLRDEVVLNDYPLTLECIIHIQLTVHEPCLEVLMHYIVAIHNQGIKDQEEL
jgi:hypothetical protein